MITRHHEKKEGKKEMGIVKRTNKRRQQRWKRGNLIFLMLAGEIEHKKL